MPARSRIWKVSASSCHWAVSRVIALIDEIVREGARRMLAEALQAEVDAYIARFADERDEHRHRLVVRNGAHAVRDVLTSAGSVPVVAPRVNDKRIGPETGERQRFSSAILPPWARKTPRIDEVLPLLYLHRLSSGALLVCCAASDPRGEVGMVGVGQSEVTQVVTRPGIAGVSGQNASLGLDLAQDAGRVVQSHMQSNRGGEAREVNLTEVDRVSAG